ncbi:MAG: metal ABC transporter permease [bacterium]|nr:metal ABC transporter permease [Candidatus Sumerlaeota bacterium]
MMFLWQAAAVLAGSSTGLLGVYVVGFRMPFLGIAMAHAAMAGAVLACLLGLPVGPLALLFALLAAAVMAWLVTTHLRADLNTVTSILLSLTMGLAFLGIGLNKGDMTPLLGLMWGSLLFVRPADVWIMLAMMAALVLFVTMLGKEMDAMLFSRNIARACGVNDRLVLVLFLVLAAVIITVNLQIVGGLLMYSLLTNPAAAAFEIGRGMRAVRFLAASAGALGAVGGFWLSYPLNLPTGACIVIVSALLYAVALAAGQPRRTRTSTDKHGRTKTGQRVRHQADNQGHG